MSLCGRSFVLGTFSMPFASVIQRVGLLYTFRFSSALLQNSLLRSLQFVLPEGLLIIFVPSISLASAGISSGLFCSFFLSCSFSSMIGASSDGQSSGSSAQSTMIGNSCSSEPELSLASGFDSKGPLLCQ